MVSARQLQKQHQCAVRGCTRIRAPGSRYCPRHRDLLAGQQVPLTFSQQVKRLRKKEVDRG